MWNMIKSDIYRIFHTKSFWVLMIVNIVGAFFWAMPNTGLTVSMPYAPYDSSTALFTDFMYTFPKMTMFLMLVFLGYTLYLSEEYTSGFIKNIYPMMIDKWKLALAKIIPFFVYYLSASLFYVIIGIIVFSINHNGWGNLYVLDYVVYFLIQLLLNTLIASFLSLLIHLTKKNLLSIFFSIGYTFYFTFSIHAMIVTRLSVEMNYVENTIIYLSGNLPYQISDVYIKTVLIGAVCLVLSYMANVLVLKKKDL